MNLLLGLQVRLVGWLGSVWLIWLVWFEYIWFFISSVGIRYCRIGRSKKRFNSVWLLNTLSNWVEYLYKLHFSLVWLKNQVISVYFNNSVSTFGYCSVLIWILIIIFLNKNELDYQTKLIMGF